MSDFFFEPPDEAEEVFFLPSFLSSGWNRTGGVGERRTKGREEKGGSHREEVDRVAEVAEAITEMSARARVAHRLLCLRSDHE